MKLLLLFIILNIINVIVQTIKSIATIKCGKLVAAVVNAIAFGIYTILLVYINSDLNLWTKVAVTAGANLLGVYAVKWFEEKIRKDKLWKVEMTIPQQYTEELHKEAKAIPHSYSPVGYRYSLFNFYCATQKETKIVNEMVKKYHAKYFISESKEF